MASKVFQLIHILNSEEASNSLALNVEINLLHKRMIVNSKDLNFVTSSSNEIQALETEYVKVEVAANATET